MVPVHIEHADFDRARLTTSYLRAWEGLLSAIENPPARAEEPTPEPFTDPAALLPKGQNADGPDSFQS